MSKDVRRVTKMEDKESSVDVADYVKVIGEKQLSKSPQPDLINCAETSIFLAKQNNSIGLFGDTVVAKQSQTNKSSPLMKSSSPLERLKFFNDSEVKTRKKSEPIKKSMRPKFVKSASIARLLGNNYSTSINSGVKSIGTPAKKSGENLENKCILTGSSFSIKTNSVTRESSHSRKLEKFHKCTDKELSENDLQSQSTFSASVTSLNCDDFGHLNDRSLNGNGDLSLRALRSFTKGLGKLLRRRTDSVEISAPDPEFKVSYLGNVLTGWAKGKTALLIYLCICLYLVGRESDSGGVSTFSYFAFNYTFFFVDPSSLF